MTDRHAFLLAIKDNPDEDLSRLAFADWLEEHGEGERAELIRVQCELARLESVPHNGHRSLHSNECEGCAAEVDGYEPRIRVTDLIVLYSRKWLPGEILGTAIPGCLEGVTQGGVCLWSRGVAEEAVFSWEAWRSHGDLIWERELPWRVRLTTQPDWFPEPESDKLVVIATRWPGIDFEMPPVRAVWPDGSRNRREPLPRVSNRA